MFRLDFFQQKEVVSNFESSFQTLHFPVHLSASSKNIGCGITAISMLTGENVLKLFRKYKQYVKNFPDDVLLQHLRAKKFEILKIKNKALGEFDDSHFVEKNHVVLLSLRINSENASWGIIYDHMLYHNFEVSALTPLTFINMPIMTSYFIKHPKWKN